MVRSIGAVLAGYFVFAASAVLIFQLTGREPHADAPLAFKIATTVWGAVFAMVAGFVAGHVSVRRPTAHAAAVAAVIAVGALISIVADSAGAHWSQIAAIVLMAPCAWLGGTLAAKEETT